MKPIRRVAVLGAGVPGAGMMGSRLAAHFANAHIPSLLLDANPGAARYGVETALNETPAAFFTPHSARLITTGTFDSDLAQVRDCDWIIEAIAEDLAMKRALLDRVREHRAPGTIVSGNTNGLPLRQIAEGYSQEFREHFLGVHFFNPPRSAHLVEIIPGPATRPEIAGGLAKFCDWRLGKGVVICKDTPGFIANRLGAFFDAAIQRLRIEHDLSAEETEALTGRGLSAERLKACVALDDKAGRARWQLLSDYILYAARTQPEIADRIVEIDRAMRWGYGHIFGPFELWDVLGFEATARRMESEGRELPKCIHDMLWAQAKSFYRAADHAGQPHTEYFDLAKSKYAELEPRSGVTILAEVKRARGAVDANAGASLIDLGDGVLCCEFHSKMNSVGSDVSRMIRAGLDALEKNFDAMIIANQGPAFSAGADLKLILTAAENEKWDELDTFIHNFQQLNMALKYALKPVVAAPFGMALGGGCEIPLHCARIQASAELSMGLVELGVGLIPAGGGCKEMLLRSHDSRKIFEQIGRGKVSGSAAEAREWGFLRDGDRISTNPERLVEDAKQLALSLAPGYAPVMPGAVTVSGEAGYAVMRMDVWTARQSGFITDYDVFVGEKLAHVLSGGRLTGTPQVSEQYLLDLEREAFLSLCGRKETRQRIQHMLKTGTCLRN